MIYFYSGTPGSGKSLHVASDILFRLRNKKNVIANFDINIDVVRGKRKKIGDFIYLDNSEITVNWLLNYALKNHKRGKEAQTLVVLDECQIFFNPREFTRKDRLEWITFLSQHRKYGYNFILISQNDRLVDKQIRAFFEYEVKHRKITNNGNIGFLLRIFGQLFVAVEFWYGVKSRTNMTFFRYKRILGKMYDSYKMFNFSFEAGAEPTSGGCPASNENKISFGTPQPSQGLSGFFRHNVINGVKKLLNIFCLPPNEKGAEKI